MSSVGALHLWQKQPSPSCTRKLKSEAFCKIIVFNASISLSLKLAYWHLLSLQKSQQEVWKSTIKELSVKGKGKTLQRRMTSLNTCRGRVILVWAALEITRKIKNIVVHEWRCWHCVPHSPRNDPLWEEQQRECFAAQGRVPPPWWVALGGVCTVLPC